MTQGTQKLRGGIVMMLVTVAEISPVGPQFSRVVVQGPGLTELEWPGLAPVFKLFIPRERGLALELPTFDKNYLAVKSWESDPNRPIGRAYTARDFDREAGQVTFDVLDLELPNSWLDRCAVGDQLGFVGFKNPLQLHSGITKIVAVGDLSARPAIESIEENASDGVEVFTYIEQPNLSWSEVTAERSISSADTTVWIGGEVADVARLRRDAIAAGFPAEQILALAYWSRGRTRDEFDRDLYRRYQDAAAAGWDISDSVVAAEIELN